MPDVCACGVRGRINRAWLEKVTFFRGMTTPSGRAIAAPAEPAFLARVATELRGEVYAPDGQVAKLIEEARDPRNLCALYSGWGSFL